MVVDRNFDWTGDNFQMPNWNETVIYELHIGTFSRPQPNQVGTFNDAIQMLGDLQSLGINAIEIMPAFDFGPSTSMGYNPGLPFAIDNAYGELSAMKGFIKAAHQRGIAVILDVVYNHFGPEGLDDCLGKFDGNFKRLFRERTGTETGNRRRDRPDQLLRKMPPTRDRWQR